MTNKIKASNLDTNAVTADAISYPLTTFSSTGIDDNATSTAITIDSSQNVGIGTTSPNTLLHLKSNNAEILFEDSNPDDAREAKIHTNAGDLIFQVGDDLTGTPTVDGQLTMFDGGSLIYSQSGTNRFNINTSGNVGIGTSSPLGRLSVDGPTNSGTFHVGTIGGNAFGISVLRDKDDTDDQILHFATPENSSKTRACEIEMDYSSTSMIIRCGFYDQSTYDINDANDDSNFPERMKFNSSNLQLNGAGVQDTSNPGWTFVGAAAAQNQQLEHASSNTGGTIAVWRTSSGQAGTISTSGTSTSYNTSSDYRLKENVSYDFDATTRLKQLRPARFNFISDTAKTVDGFLAHEVSSVVPEAITGTHNEVEVWKEGEELPEGVSVGDNKLDGEGNTIPVYQGIDQSKLVPLLVKTIQESIAKIETLETENTSMKARLDALENA